MSISAITIQQFWAPNHQQFDSINNPFSGWRAKSGSIKCCKGKIGERERQKKKKKNYYELLGVSVDSRSREIKEAYRKLQKKYHPDIAGQKGHDYTLRLNEAYKVLMREDLRKEYDASIGQLRVGFGKDTTGLGYSSWNGILRSQALFVDENACTGCRECVHYANNTFTMDEALGCARVKVQYGDTDEQIEVAVDSCPVNCIHWVDREELAVLEFLMKPRLKEGHGIFGQGWERPANVFAAAKSFHKQSNQNEQQSNEQETPAQVQARVNASMKIKMEGFSKIWNWVKEAAGR